MTDNRLRRGPYLPPFGPFGDPGAVVDLAVRAEAAGWDGVFRWDHVVHDVTPIADSWTLLGAMNPDGIDLIALADVGATWWLESLIHFDPLELLEVVDAGPPPH